MAQNLLNILVLYRDYLKKLFPQTIGYIINGELIIKVPQNKIKKFLNNENYVSKKYLVKDIRLFENC